MKTLDEVARRLSFWGALFLIVWAGYELSVRWDTIQRAGYTVMSMAGEYNVSLWNVLFKHRFIDVLSVPLVLLGCALTGVVALLLRNRRRSAVVIIPLCILFAVLNVQAKVFFLGGLWQVLKTVPLLMIGAGEAINLGVDLYIGNKRKANLPAAPQHGHRFLGDRNNNE